MQYDCLDYLPPVQCDCLDSFFLSPVQYDCLVLPHVMSPGGSRSPRSPPYSQCYRALRETAASEAYQSRHVRSVPY